MRDLKSFGLAVATFLLVAGGIVAQVLAAGVTVRPEVVARADSLRLGDVFDGLIQNEDAAIGNAPQLGESYVIDMATLGAIAKRHGLEWQPANPNQTVRVARAARTIDGGEIEALLSRSIAERLQTDEFEIDMSADWPSVVVPAEVPDGPALLDLKIEPRTGRFQAQIIGWAGAPSEKLLRLNGRIVRTESIPVPARSIGAGEVIREADLQWRRFPADRLGQDPVLNADAIVGKAPRRALRAGLPVRAGDLVVPLLIEKNAPVTMVYIAPGIQLTMMGKALEGGAQGDWIRVLNPQSKQIAYGTVSAEGLVVVGTGSLVGDVALGMNEGEIW